MLGKLFDIDLPREIEELIAAHFILGVRPATSRFIDLPAEDGELLWKNLESLPRAWAWDLSLAVLDENR